MNDQAHLLEALARFLGELPPAVGDAGLAFRVRIAAWLAAGLARELRLADEHVHARAARLAPILDLSVPALEGAALVAWVDAADRQLAWLLRTDALDASALAAARAHIVATLGETLDVTQPAFDRRPDVELPEASRP